MSRTEQISTFLGSSCIWYTTHHNKHKHAWII